MFYRKCSTSTTAVLKALSTNTLSVNKSSTYTLQTYYHNNSLASAAVAVAVVVAMEEKHYSLVFVRRMGPASGRKELLLGMKKRGFGTGKWNGYGGKQEVLY